MKRIIVLFLTFVMICFSGCNTVRTVRKEITCEDVITVYQEAGYSVFHVETAGSVADYPWVCYVRVDNVENDDYMYFHFFETHEEALAYHNETRYASVGIFLFSIIYGKPTWATFKVYNNIEIEYDHSYMYKPFRKLL